MSGVAGVIAIAVILTPTFAWADWDYAHWGMTPDQVAQASGGAVKVLAPAMRTQHAAPFDSVTAASGTYVEGALKLSMSFSFDLTTNGLSCIIFETMDPSQNKTLKESFARRYGPPQTTGGAPDLGMDSFAWYKPDEVMLTLMTDSGSFASVCKPGTQPPFES
jgi:hypothetical protein